MNTINKVFLSNQLGFEHLEDINTPDNQVVDGTSVDGRREYAKKISAIETKDAVVDIGKNIKDITKTTPLERDEMVNTALKFAKMNEGGKRNDVDTTKAKQYSSSYETLMNEYNKEENPALKSTLEKTQEDFVKVVSTKLQKILENVLKDPDVSKTYSDISGDNDKFLFKVGLYQLLSTDYQTKAKEKKYENTGDISKLVDFVAGPALVESLAWTSEALKALSDEVITIPNRWTTVEESTNDKLMKGIPKAKNNPIAANETDKLYPSATGTKEAPVTKKEIIKNPESTKEVEKWFELGDTGLNIAKNTDGNSSVSFEGNKVSVWFTKNGKSNSISFTEGEVSAPEGKVFALNGEKFRFVPDIKRNKVIVKKIDSTGKVIENKVTNSKETEVVQKQIEQVKTFLIDRYPDDTPLDFTNTKNAEGVWYIKEEKWIIGWRFKAGKLNGESIAVMTNWEAIKWTFSNGIQTWIWEIKYQDWNIQKETSPEKIGGKLEEVPPKKPEVSNPKTTVETDKTKKEIRKENKLDKSQEKSTEAITNESYSGKRIQKASEEIIVQALEETLKDNENVGDAIGLSKTLTTLQDEHKKKAKSLDATSREDQDKLITSKEEKVKSNEDKLMDVNDSATAKILTATKDEIKTLDKKGEELESIKTSTEDKETERTDTLEKASSKKDQGDRINLFNKANTLRGEIRTEKMREVKNIQDKTTKVSDYYKGHLDAVNKSALIFQNRVERYGKAVNSITTSINSYAQQFQKNIDQKQLSTTISEDATGNVVFPAGFDNFLNLPTTLGAAVTQGLYNKVLENSNTELRTEIDYLYLKLTGVKNAPDTDVTKLDLTKKEGDDNYNTILAQAQKSLGVIESEKSNLQNIYKTGPDGYIMIKGNQEADMKEYEILYSEFSRLTQEYLKGENEYNKKTGLEKEQLLWDSPEGRRMQYKKWINETAVSMNALVGNMAESADTATALLAKNPNYTDVNSIKYLYPTSEATRLSTFTTGKIGTANTLLKTFDGQENNKLPYELANPVKKSVLKLGDDISSNTDIDYKTVAKDYKDYIEKQGK